MDALKLLSRSTGLKPKTFKSLPTQNFEPESKNPGNATKGVGGKRKRGADDVIDADREHDDRPLSDQEIRQIQKKQNIKIVDLNLFRGAGDLSESKKSQKESSRIFP